MDILISCHCEEAQDPIYIFDASGAFRPISTLTKDELREVNIASYRFLDIECAASDRQYTSWTSVPTNSKDIIYMMNCPLYNQLRDTVPSITQSARAIWTDIMTDAWRILRPGGKILIPPLLGGPYVKRNAAGKVMKDKNAPFIRFYVDDDAEYQKDNAVKILEKLKNDYNVEVPDWRLSTALTSSLPFRIAVVSSGNNMNHEISSAKRMPEKHIIFMKPTLAVVSKKQRRKTRKNDRRTHKTRRSRR